VTKHRPSLCGGVAFGGRGGRKSRRAIGERWSRAPLSQPPPLNLVPLLSPLPLSSLSQLVREVPAPQDDRYRPHAVHEGPAPAGEERVPGGHRGGEEGGRGGLMGERGGHEWSGWGVMSELCFFSSAYEPTARLSVCMCVCVCVSWAGRCVGSPDRRPRMERERQTLNTPHSQRASAHCGARRPAHAPCV